MDEPLHSMRPASGIASERILTAVQRFILDLMVEGYTVPAIIDRLRLHKREQSEQSEQSESEWEVPYADIVRMYQDHYQAIREERTLRDTEFRSRGLGTRVGRARRLEKLAEQLESLAGKTPAWARAYADIVAKLDAVMEPDEKVHIPESDEWMQHLKRLSQLPMPILMPPVQDPVTEPLPPSDLDKLDKLEELEVIVSTSWGTPGGSTE